jgi:hypothetical protein
MVLVAYRITQVLITLDRQVLSSLRECDYVSVAFGILLFQHLSNLNVIVDRIELK